MKLSVLCCVGVCLGTDARGKRARVAEEDPEPSWAVWNEIVLSFPHSEPSANIEELLPWNA